jgi:hypothetical protein
LLARYDVRQKPGGDFELFETRSNRFVTFPGHVADLFEQAPKRMMEAWELDTIEYLKDRDRAGNES